MSNYLLGSRNLLGSYDINTFSILVHAYELVRREPQNVRPSTDSLLPSVQLMRGRPLLPKLVSLADSGVGSGVEVLVCPLESTNPSNSATCLKMFNQSVIMSLAN